MDKIGVFLQFRAKPGMRNELAIHLVQASESYADEAGTEVFTIHVSPVEPDTVLVYERYRDAQAKETHESAPGYAAIRDKTDTFLAGPPLALPLLYVGGKE